MAALQPTAGRAGRKKLRVMVDANVLLAGVVWPRWPHEVLEHARRGDFRLVLLPLVIEQARHRLVTRFPAYVDKFEATLRAISHQLVKNPTPNQVARHVELVRDVTDVPIALAAINARVDYLVSEDKDLTAQDETTTQLRKRVTVLLSGTFLREVMGWSSDDLERVRGRTWRDLPQSERSEEE